MTTMLARQPTQQPNIADHQQTLMEDGYCVVPDLLPASEIAALDADLGARFAATPFCEGGFYGYQTKRFGSLLKRSRHAAALIQHSVILDIAQRTLSPWCDTIQLNLAQTLELHPGALPSFHIAIRTCGVDPLGNLSTSSTSCGHSLTIVVTIAPPSFGRAVTAETLP